MSAASKEATRRYKSLLEQDPNLRRWFLNNTKGSVIVAEVYLRRLGSFCIQGNISPADYAKLPKRKMEELAFDYVQEMETKINPKSGKKYAPSYIESNLKAILSWARWNRKAFEMSIKIADSTKRPTLENERVPTNDELRRVLYADTTLLRARTAIAIMAFAGTRPEVMGNYAGLDGLRIKDIKDLSVKGNVVTFDRIPALVIVRTELSKSRHWYPTFLLEEGCEILKQYLERRIKEGEDLVPESGIIVSGIKDQKRLSTLTNIVDTSPFLRTTNLGKDIRRAMRRAGLPWRPYIFRSYFDTMQMLAESKGHLTHFYAQCFCGHSGDIETVYSLRKAELPPELLEDMRAAYSRMSELLGTMKNSNLSENRITEKFNRQFLLLSGWSESEVNSLGIDLGTIEQEKLQELIARKNEEQMGLKNGSSQKVVAMSEVEKYILDGWEYVKDLGEKAIIKLPK